MAADCMVDGRGTSGGYSSSGTGNTGYSSGYGSSGTGLGSSGTSTTAGPHSSDLANKADPRVDSDRGESIIFYTRRAFLIFKF